MGKMGFYFDMEACIGCRTCQIACKDRNNLDVGVKFRQVKNFETGVYPKPSTYNYSASCNHCAEAKCVKGCPTGALYYSEDGTVQHDKKKCIGCQYCVWNCPYGVPQYIESSGVIGKCDSCRDIRAQGGNPVCVDSCIMRCLHFGDLEELKAIYGPKVVNELPILPSADITKPSLLVKPKGCSLNANYREKEM